MRLIAGVAASDRGDVFPISDDPASASGGVRSPARGTELTAGMFSGAAGHGLIGGRVHIIAGGLASIVGSVIFVAVSMLLIAAVDVFTSYALHSDVEENALGVKRLAHGVMT